MFIYGHLYRCIGVCLIVSSTVCILSFGIHHWKRLEFVSRTRYRQVLQLNRMQKQINVARARDRAMWKNRMMSQ